MLENVYKHSFQSVLQLLGGKLCRNPKFEILSDWIGNRMTRLVQFAGPWWAEIVEDNTSTIKWIRLGHRDLPAEKVAVVEEAMGILCNHAYQRHMQFVVCDECEKVVDARPCMSGQEMMLTEETCSNCKK
jgi:hypothetical protein